MTEPVFFPVPAVPESAPPNRELAIAELLSRQRTLATFDQLEELGLSRRGVRRRAEIGRLHRVHPAVYSTTPPSLLPARARWLAAVLACGPRAYLSHRSAAALWGIRASSRSAVDVTTPAGRGRKLDGIDAHRARTLTRAVDFLWRDLRVIVETDGRNFHRTDWSREEDARRDLLLTAAGWHPVRITWRMVFITPAETTRTLGGVLTRAQMLARAS